MQAGSKQGGQVDGQGGHERRTSRNGGQMEQRFDGFESRVECEGA